MWCFCPESTSQDNDVCQEQHNCTGLLTQQFLFLPVNYMGESRSAVNESCLEQKIPRLAQKTKLLPSACMEVKCGCWIFAEFFCLEFSSFFGNYTRAPVERTADRPTAACAFTANHFLFTQQLLQMVAVSEKRWRAQSRGGGADGWGDEDEEGFQSGDCDDEDECMGVSGLGPPLRRKRLRIFAG